MAEVGVAKSGLRAKVGWNSQPSPSGEERGFEGELPNDYGMPAEELAELMEQLRVRFAPREMD